MFVFGLQLMVVSVVYFGPLLAILLQLDPYYYVFELILPSPYDRSVALILTIYFARLLIGYIWFFEFLRFNSILVFVAVCCEHTMLTILKQLTTQSKIFPERLLLHIYSQLSIVMNTGDYFLRNTLLIFISYSQVLIIITMWMVIRCWRLLPPYLTFLFGIGAIVTAIGVMLLIPQGVEICEYSHTFVTDKRDAFHSFNKANRNYYYFLKWKSQRMLPVKFGTQFTLNKDLPINYLDVLMANLTDAVLLIYP